MAFAAAFIVLLTLQATTAVDYWVHRDDAQESAGRLRVMNLVVGVGLIVLAVVAWDGFGIDLHEACSSLAPGGVRSSEEYVLGASLIAAALSVVVAWVARRPRRVVTRLVALALGATVIATLYFLDHAYRMSCWDD